MKKILFENASRSFCCDGYCPNAAFAEEIAQIVDSAVEQYS